MVAPNDAGLVDRPHCPHIGSANCYMIHLIVHFQMYNRPHYYHT